MARSWAAKRAAIDVATDAESDAERAYTSWRSGWFTLEPQINTRIFCNVLRNLGRYTEPTNAFLTAYAREYRALYRKKRKSADKRARAKFTRPWWHAQAA